MKKLTALISALALLLFLCACSSEAGVSESKSVSTQPPASQAVSKEPVQDTDPVKTPAGETDTPEQPSGEPSAAPSEDIETPEPSVSSETPAVEPTQALSADDLKAIAVSLIDHPVSELYDAIGQPLASDYTPSCVGDVASEDGELYYGGFTVYTVRTADREYVYDVL